VIVRVSKLLKAPAEQAFDAWLDPEIACKFLFATPQGEMQKTQIDARVGGSFLIIERRDGVSIDHTGVYLEINRPRRITFLFSVPAYSRSTTRVSIGVLRMEGGCEVVVAQEGVEEAQARQVEEGWRSILEGLQAVLIPAAAPVVAE
jgi:uncharacterized protein YndB with AHSA1/START domain